MYEAFYGLTEKPFNLTPDPRFLFLSEKHKEAFAHLLYGIKNRSGFVMVTGEIGTGKTTICRTLLNQLDPDTEVAFIFNPCLSPEELLRKINEDFGIDSKADTVKDLIDELNAYLLDRATNGKNCVLVIDEAQNLKPTVLEQVRLLSNLETETQKLLQIVLIGQPELGQHLALPELRQLNQRITARYHLTALNQDETLQYIAYRLRVAGGKRKVRFTHGAVKTVFKHSAGTPRVINAICDRALLIGYTLEQNDISPTIIGKAFREIRGEHLFSKPSQWWKRYVPSPAFLAAVILIVLAGTYLVAPLAVTLTTMPIRFSPLSEAPTVAPPLSAKTDIVEAAAPTDQPNVSVAVTAVQEKIVSDPIVATPASAFAAMLGGLSSAEARNAAAVSLLRAWDMALVSGYPASDSVEEIATFANANGLVSETLATSLAQIEYIGLPCFIQVTSPTQVTWLGLLGVENDHYRISTKMGEAILVSRSEIEPLYMSRAVVLWRDAVPNAHPLKPDMRGDAVAALQQQLKIIGLLETTPTGVFDAPTESALRKLQQEAGIIVDGVLGPQTRMALVSRNPDYKGPLLNETRRPTQEQIASAKAAQTVTAVTTQEQPATSSTTTEPVPLPQTAPSDLLPPSSPVQAAPTEKAPPADAQPQSDSGAKVTVEELPPPSPPPSAQPTGDAG